METMNKITKNEFKKNHTMHYRVREKVVCSNNMIAESSYIEITKILMLDMKMDMLLNIQRIRVFHNETVLGQMRSQ